MAVKDRILDGLAWAGVSDAERVARISALLVRETAGTYDQRLTKTRLKEAVKETCPPYGKGKAISELVTVEVERQRVIYEQRQAAHQDYAKQRQHLARMDTRLNRAYARTFDRPHHTPYTPYTPPDAQYNIDRRVEWEDAERERDKGDRCLALTHWQDHIVCLVHGINENHRNHIATRLRGGEIVRTYLRESAEDLVEAAILLGGPKVRAAFAGGVRVTTDWVGRITTVHYTDRREVTLPWRAARFKILENEYGYSSESLVFLLITGKDEVEESD